MCKLHMLPMAMAWSSSDDGAICCAFLALLLACFHNRVYVVYCEVLAEVCQSVGGNAEGQSFSLAIHDGLLLWWRTICCIQGQSLLSSLPCYLFDLSCLVF